MLYIKIITFSKGILGDYLSIFADNKILEFFYFLPNQNNQFKLAGWVGKKTITRGQYILCHQNSTTDELKKYIYIYSTTA